MLWFGGMGGVPFQGFGFGSLGFRGLCQKSVLAGNDRIQNLRVRPGMGSPHLVAWPAGRITSTSVSR